MFLPMIMKEIVYYKYNTSQVVFFLEDDECIFDFKTQKPIAFMDENIWFDFKTSQPIAFEQDGVVFDYKTQRPLCYYEY